MDKQIITTAFPNYLSDQQKELAKRLLNKAHQPQVIIDIANWAERKGKSGTFLEVVAWLTYEHNQIAEFSDEVRYFIEGWLDGVLLYNRPGPAGIPMDQGEEELIFPPQTTTCEQWLALHEMDEIVISLVFDPKPQSLLDAWAWRLHQAADQVDAMDIFTNICNEFPMEVWKYPTTDIFNFQPPVGDLESIVRDAQQWQRYNNHIAGLKALEAAERQSVQLFLEQT